jgi:hypothetical protein
MQPTHPTAGSPGDAKRAADPSGVAMERRDVQARNGRDAIAVMTAWADRPSDDALVKETILQIVRDRESALDGLRDVTFGLITLCGHLMALRQREQGVSHSETLQHLGRMWH